MRGDDDLEPLVRAAGVDLALVAEADPGDLHRLHEVEDDLGQGVRSRLAGVMPDEDLGGEDDAPPDLDVGPGPERSLGSGSVSEPEEDVGVPVLRVEVEVVPGDDREILAGGGPVSRERGANGVAELGGGSGRSANYARVLVPPGKRSARSMLTSTQPASAWSEWPWASRFA